MDEASEGADGVWFKRGNISTFIDRARVVRIEYPKPAGETAAPEPAESNTRWRLADAGKPNG